jgi:Ca-activated chloride channel family protein
MRKILRQLLGSRKALLFGLYGAGGGIVAALIGEAMWSFAENAGTPLKGPPVDIVFVLDVTSSMRAEMNGVKSGIQRFVTALTSRGFDAQVGLIAFGDRFLPGGEPRLLQFDGSPLTRNLEKFRSEVSTLRLVNGGDPPESSLDAVVLATHLPFRREAAKVLLLITDAPPHVPDRETKTIDAAATRLRKAGISQLHIVTTRTDRPVYLPLQKAAPGDFFPLSSTASGRAGFERILPSVGTRIAERATEGVASRHRFGAQAEDLLLATAGAWTALLGAGIAIWLNIGHNHYLRRPLLPRRSGIVALIGGSVAGALAGIAGQSLFDALGENTSALWLARVASWGVLGLLIGLATAFFVPNLRRVAAALGGLVGGILGALAFLFTSALIGDTPARLLGAGTLGFGVGVMLALLEVLSLEACLIVHWSGRESSRLSIGETPIVIGSALRAHIPLPLAMGYPAVAATVTLRDRRVELENYITDTRQRLDDGERVALGPIVIELELGR